MCTMCVRALRNYVFNLSFQNGSKTSACLSASTSNKRLFHLSHMHPRSDICERPLLQMNIDFRFYNVPNTETPSDNDCMYMPGLSLR